MAAESNLYALHIHTTHSDGQTTVDEVWGKARDSGLSGIGICDHHTFSGVEEAISKGIPVLAGVEVTCLYKGQGVHILGYFPDFKKSRPGEALTRLFPIARNATIARVEKVIQNIRGKLDELKAQFPDIKTDHVTLDTILKGKSPDDLVTKDAAPLIIQSGILSHFPQTDKPEFDAYTFYKNFKLEADYADFPFPKAEEVVEALKKYGGIPVLPHPGKVKGLTPKDHEKDPSKALSILEDMVSNLGLEGLETHHHDHYKTRENLGGENEFIKWLVDFCGEKKLLAVKGVDIHFRFQLEHIPLFACAWFGSRSVAV